MITVTVEAILHKAVNQALGHLIYAVREGSLVFYIGQSRRDVVTRFWEHLQSPSRLGQLILLNEPDSRQWSVDFYALADCATFVQQKSLFPMQEWQHFDMDMAEKALIQTMQPVLNHDFNEHPTPLPAHYQGHTVLGLSLPKSAASPTLSPKDRIWFNRMSLQGWVYAPASGGRLRWEHASGKILSEAEMAPYRQAGKLPPL